MPATSLEPLFVQMEAQVVGLGTHGTLERRIPCQGGFDLFVGVCKPANLRSFRARFTSASVPPGFVLPAFRGFDAQVERSTEEGIEYATIRLRLTSTAFNDVFTSLAEDISESLAGIVDESAAAAGFAARLAKWQRFLQLHGAEGLSLEEQRGLYGELVFLRDCLLPVRPAERAVSSWTGPSLAAKDFEFCGAAVEVKTTVAKQPQVLRVASERQLDDTGLARLYVFHLSLEPIKGHALTLPALVDEVRQLIAAEPTGAAVFEDRLMEAGYFDVHAHRYSDVGYVERERSIFRVGPGFPRIVESQLASGVGDVRYSLDVAACRPYSVQAEDLALLVTAAEGITQ